jgi:hypothetical protein
LSVVDDIIEARVFGWTDCGYSVQQSPSLSELANEFSLATDSSIYREIDATEARRVVQAILQVDFVFGARIMAPTKAADLAERFLSQFGTDATRYFTNGAFDESGRLEQWKSATESTFDAGVLVIGTLRSGCLWVEQED